MCYYDSFPIYIYKEREREREREKGVINVLKKRKEKKKKKSRNCPHMVCTDETEQKEASNESS